MKPTIALRRALTDPLLLGKALAGESWSNWRTLLIAAMGEELTGSERSAFKVLTGRDREPGTMVEELCAIVGRRGGKSRAISVLAAYVAGLCSHPSLVPGERGVLLIIAPDTKQSQICLDYVTANFEASSILKQLVAGRFGRELRLKNDVDIKVRASDFRTLRGPTYIAVIADESAFWYSDNSANPDAEILNAVRPGLATTGGPLFMISSPYARRGELWRTYQKHFGPDGDPMVLVAQGASRVFNQSLPQRVVDRAIDRDPASAAAEFMAEFRKDIESFVSIEAVRACTIGLHELPPQRGINYSAFVDPSGGSSDSFTLAIGHFDHGKQTVITDCLREVKPPFSPEQVVAEFTKTLRTYRVIKVISDRYAGVWVTEQFSRFNILCEQSARPKSELYLDLLPLINSRRIQLLDNPKLIAQLTGLERRTARGGKDSIDHGPGGHDDLANAVAGLASITINDTQPNYSAYTENRDGEDETKAWQRWRRNAYYESGGAIKLW